MPLPNKVIMDSYLELSTSHKVSNEPLITYKGNKYSVPKEYIHKTVKCKESNNTLFIYYNKDLIGTHEITNKKINYDYHHYKTIMVDKLPYKSEDEIAAIAEYNLKLLDNI